MQLAKWGGKIFEVSASTVKSFKDLSYGIDLETEDKESNHQKYATKKNRKARTVSVKMPLMHGLGVNVRTETEWWMEQANTFAEDYFYLADTGAAMKKLFECKMMLTKVAVSDVDMATNGTMLHAMLALTFTQSALLDGEQATGGDGGGGGGSGSKKASSKRQTNTKLDVKDALITNSGMDAYKNLMKPSPVGADLVKKYGVKSPVSDASKEVKRTNDAAKAASKSIFPNAKAAVIAPKKKKK